VNNGDLQLGALKQSIGGSLVLNVDDGQITTQAGTTGFERSVGSLTANARNNVDLQLRRLQRLNANSQTGNLLITVEGEIRDLLQAESLKVDETLGKSVTLDAGLSGLAVAYASQIQAANLSLKTLQDLLIDSNPTASTYLVATDQLELSYSNLQADPEQVILATTRQGGSITLSIDQLALANALPKLPLLQSDIVELSGRGGLRLTDQSFNDQQIDNLIPTLLFTAPKGPNQVIPVYWPYELDLEEKPDARVTQLLEDDAGIPYVYKRIPGDLSGPPRLYSHYQPSDQDASGYPYLYQAITIAGSSDAPVVQFRSNQKLLTAANLEQSALLGIAAASIDPTTITPVLALRSPSSVHAAFVDAIPGSTLATAIIADLASQSKAIVLDIPDADSLPPTQDLLELLDFVPGSVNGTTSKTLQGGVAWLDLNNNLIQDPQERKSTIAYGGRIRSPLSADSSGVDLLVAQAPQNANQASSDRRLLLGSVDHPNPSVESTVDVLLGRKGFEHTLVRPIQPEDKLIWSSTGISLAPTSSGAKFVHFEVAEAEWLASQKLTLLIYRTDEQQRVLSADGLQVADSLEQAIVAQIGAVTDDSGHILYAADSIDVRLDLGQKLQVMLRDANSSTVITPALKVDASGDGISLKLDSSPLSIHASLTEANSVNLQFDLSASSDVGELLFFDALDIVDVEFLSSSANTNILSFVKVDVNLDNGFGTPQLSVAGKPFSNTVEFRRHLLQNLELDVYVSLGGADKKSTSRVWTPRRSGYYTPIMISQLGDVFSLGSQLNRDRRVHLKCIGEGVYSFEDLSVDQNSDFDYNDGLVVIKPRSSSALTAISVDASGASAVDSNVAPAALLRSLPQSIATSDAAPSNLQLSDSDAVAGAITLEQQDGANENQRLQSQGVLNVALASDRPGVSQSDDISLFSTTVNPILQNPLQVTQPEEIPGDLEIGGDVVDAIITRGELRVAVARAAEDPADLLSWQRDLLSAVATSLGSSSTPLQLTLTSYASASEALEQLTSGMVDLVLPDDNDATWLDGIVGVDTLTMTDPNSLVLLVTRNSGINCFDDLFGRRLGLTGGARVNATLALTLSRHDAPATVRHFPDLEQARDAMRFGQVDGLVLMQASVPAVQDWLENNGIDSQVLSDILLENSSQLLLAAHQFHLRDLLFAAQLQLHHSIS